jgi:hypothetical protein
MRLSSCWQLIFSLLLLLALAGEGWGQDKATVPAGDSITQETKIEPSNSGDAGNRVVLGEAQNVSSDDGPGVAEGDPKNKKRGNVEIEDFVAFIYTPGPRDPFISPLASGTIVVEEQSTEDISVESLMAFAERLKDDLGQRIRVVGVSVPPGGQDSRALVIYASGRGENGSTVVPALPPRTVTTESGIPVRYPPEETAFISRLAALVAQNSPIRLKRDSRTESVIFPVERIDERGIQVMLPGYEEPILLPVYREVETFSGAGE